MSLSPFCLSRRQMLTALVYSKPPTSTGVCLFRTETLKRLVKECQGDDSGQHIVPAAGCRLYDADIEGSVIGLRSVVRSGARLRRMVMMGADLSKTEGQKAENHRRGRPYVGIGQDAHIEWAVNRPERPHRPAGHWPLPRRRGEPGWGVKCYP